MQKKDPSASHEYEGPVHGEVEKTPSMDSMKVTWLTADMAKQYDRDKYLATTARESLFYIIFVICLTVVAFGMVDATMYFMAQGLRDQFVDHAGIPYPEATNTSKVKFNEITTVDDMWDYLEAHLLPLMYADTFRETTQSDKGIGEENVMIGIPVIRQVMVSKTACSLPFPRPFINCYPKYSKKTMDTKNLEHTPWKYQKPKETQAATWSGEVTKYYGGGYQEELGRTLDSSNTTLQALKTGKFIQKGTRAVFIDVAYYNPNVNLFTAVKIVFELPPTGAIIPTANFYTLKLLRYVTARDFLMFACETVIIVMVVFYTIKEIRELIFLGWRYFIDFWNIVDLGVIVSVVLLFSLRITQHFLVNELLENIERAVDEHNSLQSATTRELLIRNAMAIAVFIVYLKLFKYLSFNRAMSEVHKALERSFPHLAAFTYDIAILFIGFGLFGCLLFGTELWDFTSFPLSLFALLRIIMGDFSYDSLYEANPSVAALFYLLFLGTIYFILFNLLLSIIYDCYGDIKIETSILPDKKYMTDFWRVGIYNVMNHCGCGPCAPEGLVRKSEHNRRTEDIRAALKKFGFTDLEIQMFLNRYNIDPNTRVRTDDVETIVNNMKTDIPSEEVAQPTTTAHEYPSTTHAAESFKRDLPTDREGTSSSTPTVVPRSFRAQQERLDRVEGVMASIAEKLDILLRKLNNLDVRRLSSN